MKYFYSKTTDSFYHELLIDSYKKEGTWPSDCVEVSTQDWDEFSHNHLDKKRQMTKDGVFQWVDSAPDYQSLAKLERHWRDAELNRSDIALNMVQDSDQKAVGTVSQWRTYRKELRSWPESVNFPKEEFRPKAPDYKE